MNVAAVRLVQESTGRRDASESVFFERDFKSVDDGPRDENKTRRYAGLDVIVENEKGSTRRWFDENSNETGRTLMHHDYGFVLHSIGADGDEVDVYLGPHEDAEYAYVVHQNRAPAFEKYDEDKVMLGFKSAEDAKNAYVAQYDDYRFFGGMSQMPIAEFREKVFSGMPSKKITNG